MEIMNLVSMRLVFTSPWLHITQSRAGILGSELTAGGPGLTDGRFIAAAGFFWTFAFFVFAESGVDDLRFLLGTKSCTHFPQPLLE